MHWKAAISRRRDAAVGCFQQGSVRLMAPVSLARKASDSLIQQAARYTEMLQHGQF